ncbi:glucosamine-6-phosphate deaminase [Paenarthrobacter sp. DKR-5]|uniref:glucosamine-6-phosphate deaminase n=1 Tax=Paenarthrobacter sp. DKR-5 TaxID=2835535 RepID=UPI001BDCD75F|nr:glucosamine-6-phosphate deaminase [Paenarthrobacter sp. DKR-5]MBT1003545.1 glucosamine-6-phosphate deaminase [Paenarthrobacter sp. DKR-5]
MQLRIVENQRQLGETAADMIESVIRANPRAVLGIATGSSPLPVYAALARRVRNGLDLSGVQAFALDEYVGLSAEHQQSYRNVIRCEVVEPLRMNPALVHVPDGCAYDLNAECLGYERAIKDAGGVDLQILGIGSNGHIGFNEPGSDPASETRVVDLTEQTRQDNARFFNSLQDVPKHSITQGIGTILRARQILLVASGYPKAAALKAAMHEPTDPATPASHLRAHSSATVIADSGAASQLTKGSLSPALAN